MGDIFGASPPPLNSIPPLIGSTNPLASMAPMMPTSGPSLSSMTQMNATPQKSVDPLADLLGGVLGSSAVPPPSLSALVPQPSLVPVSAPLSMMSASPNVSSEKSYVCYDKRGLKIELVAKKESPVLTQLTAVFHATGLSDATNIMLQVAVPKVYYTYLRLCKWLTRLEKALKLQMSPPESTTATMTKPAVQSMKVDNPTKTTIRLRMKLSFAIGGEKVDEMVEFSAFDPSLWA
jgi:AP-1 complex subunit gamma-1